AFLSSSSSSMTSRALASLPIDWQIQSAPGADLAAITAAVRAAAHCRILQNVGYADVAGLVAKTGGTVQTTGAGIAIGVETSYRWDFPAEIRPLLGTLDGVLLAQQAAANLHASVGDLVSIERVGQAPIEVKVDGIVDLPDADSLFQAIGIAAGAAPRAPPDNVVLMPIALWHKLFDPQGAIRPESVRYQLHVGLSREHLPSDPESAYAETINLGRNLEARLAGSGLLANNLAARLDSVREDALYARVLFLFLGAPGVILSGLLTI